MDSLRRKLIQHFDAIVFFMECRSENPFKIRAFRTGMEVLDGLSDTELEERLKNDSLRELKGIGKGIEAVSRSFQKKGTSEELDKARGDLPESLVELRELKGLGAKRILQLYNELQIKSLGELEYACNENRLVKLPGFGEKTQTKIVAEIHRLNSSRGKMLLVDALEQLKVFERQLEKAKWKFTVVGKLAQKQEIISEFEFLVADKTKADLEDLNFKSGSHRVDFHFCKSNEFGSKSVELSSSEAHWKSLKSTIAAKSEEEFYQKLGFEFYPPECREYAVEKNTPQWVNATDLQGVFHFHTTDSDGVNSLEEMLEEAKKFGWNYVGLSDHSQTAFYAQGLKEADLKKQWKLKSELEKSKAGPTLFAGIESDILKDGSLDYPEKVLKQFDFVIASIHSRYGQKEMTERILAAIDNPYTTMIGHLSGRLLLAREAYELDMKAVTERAIKKNVIIELNAHPHRLDIDWRHLHEAAKKGLLISINPDAHSREGFSDVRFGVWMARKAGIHKDQIFNTWSLDKVRKFLAEKRA